MAWNYGDLRVEPQAGSSGRDPILGTLPLRKLDNFASRAVNFACNFAEEGCACAKESVGPLHGGDTSPSPVSAHGLHLPYQHSTHQVRIHNYNLAAFVLVS